MFTFAQRWIEKLAKGFTMERCTFLSAAANELHADAKHLHTNVDDIGDHLQKASHILIAVERHDKDSEQWRNEAAKDRYLWVKGRSVSVLQSQDWKAREPSSPLIRDRTKYCH